MAWSSRQVWGFTALMLGVIVVSIVGMVTMVLFLTMGAAPEGDTLLVAVTTDPTDEATPPNTCLETPDDAFFYLPTFCAIIPSSPSSSPSPSSSQDSSPVQFLPYFNMGRCPNHMCHPDGCHGSRCCCQAVQLSSLTYYCPNEQGVLVDSIVERCGCTACADMPVVFVGMVTDTENTPIPHASVLVDDSDAYHTNKEAIFGFSVSSAQDTVVVMVTAVGYWEYRRLLGVTPGEVNIIRVQMMRQLSLTLPPSPHPLLINLLTLDVYQVTPSDGDLSPPATSQDDGGVVQSFIEFPQGLFNETFTLIGQPVALDNPASLQSLGMSFVTSSGSQTRRKRGMELRQSEGAGQSEEVEVVFVVSVGVLDVMGEEGERMEGGMSNLLVHTFITDTNLTCSDLIPFQLYLLTDMELRPAGNTSCTETDDHAHLVTLLPPLTPLPLSYVAGVSDPDTCYIAVRAFQTVSPGNHTEMTVPVWLHTTETSAGLQRVNVMFGQSNGCVPVPCHGRLVVRILDGLQYSPDNYTLLFLSDIDDVIITSDDVMANGEVFDDVFECQEMALTTDPITYFQFMMLSRQPSLVALPSSSGGNMTTPPFCSLRVGVVVPMGVASVQVMASSVSSEGVRMMRVVRVGRGGGGEGEGGGEGGSGECSDCEESHVTCVEVSCDHQVKVGVSVVMGSEDGVCVPLVKVGGEGGEGVEIEGDSVKVTEGSKVTGFIIDTSGPDASVAMEMCKLSMSTDIFFHCIT